MISEADALRIAIEAIRGRVKIDEARAKPPTIERVNGTYVVTFPTDYPVGVRGPDYFAQVTVDSQTGEVVKILGAS